MVPDFTRREVRAFWTGVILGSGIGLLLAAALCAR